MPLLLYNTLTRLKEDFVPSDPQRIGLYVCGPTVYDFAHVGNARPVVVFDVLYRLLSYLFPTATVCYVRNITDIDDKIMERSQESGEDIKSLTMRTTRQYQEDMAALKALPPREEPRATDNIFQMQELIRELIERGHAYVVEGHVLFDVQSMPTYGQLSRRNREEMLAGARVEVAPYKRDGADFVLWKPSVADIPGWDSPWGRGRPGWHVECSAMAGRYLGTSFDIHGGGQDLIFPHHENEIAQSRCAHGTEHLARVWMHNGFVTVNGEKMSKSLGNFRTVRDLLDHWPGETIRLVLLATHYRQPLDLSDQALKQAQTTLDRWYGSLEGVVDPATASPTEPTEPPEDVLAALSDDLNTPLALARLHEAAARLNRLRQSGEAAGSAALALRAGGRLMGLLQDDPSAWAHRQPAAAQAAVASALDEETIAALIAQRQQARQARDFAGADQIREQLAAAGVLLEDGAKGTRWRRA